MVTALSKPFDHNKPYEFESDKETAEVEIDLQGNEFQNKFQITNHKRCTNFVKQELAIFEVESKRGANLESCYFFCLILFGTLRSFRISYKHK
jgi:hypothetical protein